MTLDTLSIYAYDWSIQESYGRVANELADGLETMGCYVNRIGPNAPQDKPLRLSLGGIALGYPTQVRAFGKLLNAGPVVWITAFESTALPFLWADIFNTADAVIVPSPWLIDVFKSGGVETPVHAIPQGVSSAFQYVERKRNADDPYIFLAFADRGRRKAWDAAGFAFVRAFGDDPAYRLVMKSRPGSFNVPLANANMQLIEADLDDDLMASFYGGADCLIAPGREGFGLLPREFAATGGISLALDWGGTADHLHQWGLPIATAGMEAAWKNHPKLDGIGEWAVPDIDDMAATMKHVARHREHYRAWGKQASAFVRQTYDWSQYAKSVYTVWKEACENHGKRTLRPAV